MFILAFAGPGRARRWHGGCSSLPKMAELPCVMLAEDDEAMRSMLLVALQQRGLTVQACASGSELLAKIAQLPDGAPKIVVTDHDMPGASGLDVLHWLREHRPSVRVVLITAFGSELLHLRALDLGARLIIDKPFNLSELCDRVFEIAYSSAETAKSS